MKTGRNDTSLLAKEGYLFVGIAGLLVLIGWLVHPLLLAVCFLFFLFVVYFFRNPKRTIPQEEGVIVSPADGKVLFCGRVDQNHKISIFMSPLNVHINRIPVSGEVKSVVYNKGKFLGAYRDKASLDNEQNAVVMENEKKERFLFVQIAGFLARRIVCYACPGDQWKKGEIFGLIRFGSRMDIYMPLNYSVQVRKGEKVKAGESIIGRKA